METKVQAVSWNITRLCNLKCTHCYLPAGFVDTNEFPSGYYRDTELTQSQCFRVIDEIAEINPNILLILTGGEPLLRPDILKVSDYAARTGFLVVMGTNGVLLNDEMVQRMSDHGVAGAGISLDAVDPVNHDKFRGMDGAWEGTMNGVKALKRANLDFLVQTSVTRWNYDEVPQSLISPMNLGRRCSISISS